jgi:hypothetical protein
MSKRHSSSKSTSESTDIESVDIRPSGCICWDSSSSLPCFPCYARGFREPNPDPPEVDTDVDEYPKEATDE